MPPSTTTLLHQAPGVALFDFACGARRGDTGADEATTADLLVLPFHGHFEWRSGHAAHVASVNSALWCRQGQGYRVTHPVCGGDRCTVLALAPAIAPRTTMTACALPVTAKLHLTHTRLRRRLANAAEPLARDEVVLDFAAAALAIVDPDRDGAATVMLRRQVRVAQEFLHLNVARRVDLAEIANIAGSSPQHLARGFHRLVGMPMHRYQLALRARQALAAVLDGHDDLTSLALSLGFCDHAHLTRVFKKHFGVPPSAARNRLR
jgi:AraC-like DNA-binding protein